MKNPPYNYGLEPVDISERLKWGLTPLVDGSGQPTSELSDHILFTFFSNPDTSHEMLQMAEELFLDPRYLESMLRQLCVLDLIEERPINSLKFRLSTERWNKKLFEKVQAYYSQKIKATIVTRTSHDQQNIA